MTPNIPYYRPFIPPQEMEQQTAQYYAFMNQRRTLRHFSDAPVPLEVMKNIILTASSAPSGAHKQPWTFCLIGNSAIKKQIKEAAEAEEYLNYHGRMTEEWLKDLEPFGTDWHKPFLEIAPWLVVVFKRIYETDNNGKKHNNYYVNESVGIATGFLLAAIHQAGLVALTHTPSPMNFLTKVLNRPDNERPFLLIPVGYAADDAAVPQLRRKSFEEAAVVY
ncbi:nitroreductase family protein [Sphingobacteriales bacterium UPWRP_1]|nr:nitroreductase family protein [Sphingobacteriales bacterium TSM_CSS]PSJ76533.1 nitroreductase family protein [Sphingobacteriales bacterium UPWRP_1]